jgi:hypothetical protein
MISLLITYQVVYSNSGVNPSSPGILSGNRDLMMFHTSSSVKRMLKLDKLRWGNSRISSLMALACVGGVPRISSKNRNATTTFWSLATSVSPLCSKEQTWFLCQHELTCMWKNLVGASPSCNHNSRDSYRQLCVATKTALELSTSSVAVGLPCMGRAIFYLERSLVV